MERALHMNQTRGTATKSKPKNKYKKLNLLLYRLFGVLAVLAFFAAAGVNDAPDDFWKPLLICFSLFMLFSFISWYFYNPRKARYTMCRKIYNMLVSIEFFCQEVKYRGKFRSEIRRARSLGYSWKEIYQAITRSGDGR